jgi:hypothetical protein
LLGTIEEDEVVSRSVRERRPAAERYPDSRFVGGLQGVVERLVGEARVTRGA